MKESVRKKIEALTQKAKESGAKNEKPKGAKSNMPNSLAENVKTKEQANSFMFLLKSL